jgi:hypothetical protein
MAMATIESAIAGSTIRGEGTKTPVAARLKVTLCASVKAVIMVRRERRLPPSRIRPNTKRIWSAPESICSMPCSKKREASFNAK